MKETGLDTPEVKVANTSRPVHRLIRKRWSPRTFSDEPINEEGLQTLFEAASWAASSYNDQPWQYIYAHRSDEEGFQKLLSCLKEGNQKWAKDAAVLVLSMARRYFSRNDKPNRHYMHDTGAANTTLVLQAASMDIYGHMMAGFHIDKTIETFELPDEIEPVCFIALGYLGSLDESQLKPRSRKPLRDFVKKA